MNSSSGSLDDKIQIVAAGGPLLFTELPSLPLPAVITRDPRDGTRNVEQRLMLVRVEIDVHVAHQLRQLRGHAILGHHLRADASDPQQLGMRSVAEVDGLNA